jgi:hypothetical protein
MAHVSTTCPECGEPAEFDIPDDHTAATVRYEPPCGHITAHPNPNHVPETPEGIIDGTVHVGMDEAGSANDVAG